jgi:pyruvate/2-oxoglutarate/acetoin dehydrogenase E1 component
VVPDGDEAIPFGKAAIRRNGTDLTIVAHGYVATVAVEAAQRLEAAGVSAEVIDLRTLAPLDIETVCASAARTGAVLFLEEGQTICGVGAELAWQVNERVGHVRVARIGARRSPISSNPVFEAYCVPDVARVCGVAHDLLRANPPLALVVGR